MGKNLLINSNFRNPVNQRDKVIYTSGYTIDRWKHEKENSVLTLNDGYITLNSTSSKAGDYTTLRQRFEDPKLLEGRTVTLTIKGRGKIGAAIYANNYVSYNQKKYTDFQEMSTTVTLPSNITLFFVELRGFDGNDSGDIMWAKLEIGSEATPYEPLTYGEELALCQRYYLGLPVNTYAVGHNIDGSYINFYVPIPVTLRKIPTMERFNEQNYLFEVFENGNSYSDYTLKNIRIYPGHIYVRIYAENSKNRGLVNPTIVINDRVGLNAEV